MFQPDQYGSVYEHTALSRCEQDSLSQEGEVGAAEHLPLEHLDAVDEPTALSSLPAQDASPSVTLNSWPSCRWRVADQVTSSLPVALLGEGAPSGYWSGHQDFEITPLPVWRVSHRQVLGCGLDAPEAVDTPPRYGEVAIAVRRAERRGKRGDGT